MASVRLEKISKRYGDLWAARDIDLIIDDGEFFTLLGPSGCGKTTLLRTIAGFVMPDYGMVFLDNQPVNHKPAWQREIGLVFQNYALWPHMTVFENVAFGLRERKIPRLQISEKVSDALSRVGLASMEKRRPSQLSGGQQQRVALARTLVVEPKVLLLDEPLSNLDAKLRAEMRIESSSAIWASQPSTSHMTRTRRLRSRLALLLWIQAGSCKKGPRVKFTKIRDRVS